jgi:hypothetical protein
MTKQEQIYKLLTPFLPKEGINQVVGLIVKHGITFKINRKRSSKFGDYRYDFRTGKERISVNGDLNTYNFYFTAIHEFAHLEAYHKFGRKIKPHGTEWKNTFTRLLLEGKAPDWFPDGIRKELIDYMLNPKASTVGDQKLYLAFRKLDGLQSNAMNVVYLHDLSVGAKFVLNQRNFVVEKKRRTRYLCTELSTKRSYLVSGMAEVELINEQNTE